VTFSATVRRRSSCEILEDHPETAAKLGDVPATHRQEIRAVHHDVSRVGQVRPVEQAQERALSGAGRAGEVQKLAPLNLGGDPAQGRPAVVALGDVLEPDHAGGAGWAAVVLAGRETGDHGPRVQFAVIMRAWTSSRIVGLDSTEASDGEV
jgi:hypothetical protein